MKYSNEYFRKDKFVYDSKRNEKYIILRCIYFSCNINNKYMVDENNDHSKLIQFNILSKASYNIKYQLLEVLRS